MSEHQDLIERVGQQVLDGIAVDWAAVTNEAGPDGDIIESLKALEALAKIHRHDFTSLDSASLSRPEGPPASGTWGHLEILEPIGRGASAHVFRAWDTRLDREVALKLVAADRALGGNGNSPIIHEGRLLARVRHPNVVTIYGAERIGDLVGLWMEFIHGKTLEVIARERTLSPAEAIQIGAALCSAVSAVHGAGLLHRDIKAHNVMQAADGRVVLMDFGTGRELADESSADSAGTPLYLAPELFQGAAATVQSDIYSLGVLLFRLLTGTYPVPAKSLGELRRAHQTGTRLDVREMLSRVPPALARAIERAVDPLPERRWPAADLFRSALLNARSARLKTLLAAGGLATAVVLAVTATALLRQRGTETGSQRTPTPASASAPLAVPPKSEPLPSPSVANAASPVPTVPETHRPEPTDPSAASHVEPADDTPPKAASERPDRVRMSVQVVPFTNASGRASEAWLSTTLAEMVMREFRASERFRWIPGAVPLAKAQLGQALITESSSMIRPVIAADAVVSGEYVLQSEPDQLRVTLRLQEAGGRSPGVVIETGSTADLAALVSKLATRARAALGDNTRLQNRSHQPASVDAARWYAEGIWNRGTAEDCAAAMQKATAADPQFAPAYITLAECQMFVFRDRDRETPRRTAARAVELAAGLPQEERLLIEIRARVVNGGPTPAREAANRQAYEELLRLFPDTLLYGFMVARSYARFDPGLLVARGYASEGPVDVARALTAIDSVAHVPGANEDLGLLRLEGELAGAAGDFARANRAQTRAEELARQVGDGSLLGYVLLERSVVAHALNDALKELSLAEDALQTFIASGNHATPRHGRARVHMVYEDHGGFEWARKSYDELIGAARIRGDRTMLAHLRMRLGELLMKHGELAEARRLFDEVQRDGTEVIPYVAEATLRYGELSYRRGDLTAAMERFQAAVKQAGEKQDLFGNQGIWAAYKAAQTAFDLGDLQGALEHAARNIRGTTGQGPTRERCAGMSVRSRVLLARDEIDAARQAADEASKWVSPVRQTIQPAAFEVWITRALVAIAQERYAEARTFAQTAGDVAQRDLEPDREAEAAVTGALAWLAEGRVAEAQRAFAAAAPRIDTTEDRLLRLSAGVAMARIAAVSNDAMRIASARKQLEQVIRDAVEVGAIGIHFDARLALGEIQMKSGDVTAGRATLSALEQDASGKGFVRITRRAAAAAR